MECYWSKGQRLKNDAVSIDRLSSNSWAGLGQHVRLHTQLHAHGRVPGPEWRTRGRGVVQSSTADQSSRGDTGHLLSWSNELHWGAGGGDTQHLRCKRSIDGGGSTDQLQWIINCLYLSPYIIHLAVILIVVLCLQANHLHSQSQS